MNNLKQVDVKEWEVLSSCAIIEYVKENGFKNIISIKKDKDKKPYLKINDNLYVFTSEDHLGEKFDFKDREAVINLSAILARFHECSEGFIQPAGIKVQVKWGRNMEKYRGMVTRLERFIDEIESKEHLTSFEEEVSPHLNSLLKRAKKSLKVLRSIKYINTLEKSMNKREVCINNISQSSVRKYEGRIILTKVFSLGYNMCEEDLAELIKRHLEESESREGYGDIIKEYRKVRELSEYSEEIIKALVSFPFDSIKTILKYAKSKEDEDVLIGKFKKYLLRESKTDIMEV